MLVRRLVKVEMAEKTGKWEVASHMFDEEGDVCAATSKELRSARRAAALERDLMKAPSRSRGPRRSRTWTKIKMV